MDATRRTTMLGLSLIAGALALAILQVGWVMVAHEPREPAAEQVKFRFERQAVAPDDSARDSRQGQGRFYPPS